jgi:muramoyltetrapeptide carboxypeptidase LdcA involved in peptidoglycan recycling
VLRHLDAGLLAAHPKPFFGYSDNNNLNLFLWNLGLVSYQGGAIMVQFGRPAGMHPVTRDSLRHAIFADGPQRLEPSREYNDEEHNWADPDALATEFGHTDPQQIVPFGGQITVDATNRKITAVY